MLRRATTPTDQPSFESLLFGEEVPQSVPEPVELPPESVAVLPSLPTVQQGQERESIPKRDLARQKVEEGIQALATELQEGHSAAFVRWLATMSRFHRYSLQNTLLIAMQRPEATWVAGFHKWKELGRTVKKGEKGILILAPIPKRARDALPDKPDDEPEREGRGAAEQVRKRKPVSGEVWGFRAVHVFDVAQTEGEALPEFAAVQGEPAEYTDRLKKLIQAEGITLEYVPALQGALGASLGGTIKVVEGLRPAEEFSTLVHELAHELLHKDPKRRAETTKTVRETEAEAVAFVVCRSIGLEPSGQHSDYIQLYQGNVETLTASMEAIAETATRIIRGIQSEKGGE